MAIHHAQTRQAEQYGFTLTEKAPHVVAHKPDLGTVVFGVSGKDAIAQMLAILNIHTKNPDLRFRCIDDPRTHGYLQDLNSGDVSEQGTPIELYRDLDKLKWATPSDYSRTLAGYEPEDLSGVVELQFDIDPDAEQPDVDAAPLVKRSEAGVALDGAVAYKEGIMAADNPFDEGTEEADAWDEQWDQAADESPEDEGGGKGGSVVSSKYRTIYAERGHPNHCGDWLATLLNNFCVGAKETDLATFERICALNDIDTSKYNRTTPGWQGRIRMTGRNLLARKVYERQYIMVPTEQGEAPTQRVDAPADWMAAQRYKAKAA